ncbi:MAG: class I SAM-dependent methyltransferase, partial [Candidatus Uhrbacteria bacterium]|nr:class I SAM-dependent methyltransferase [Candidatus Uhrbacteria bacterium]
MAGNALLHAAAILDAIGVERGMHLADFGVGRTAHFAFPAARRVGSEGVVYAVDIHPDSLSMVEGHRKLHAQTNLETVWGDIERYGGVDIPAGSLDIILIVSTLWQARGHRDIAQEANRLIRT